MLITTAKRKKLQNNCTNEDSNPKPFAQQMRTLPINCTRPIVTAASIAHFMERLDPVSAAPANGWHITRWNFRHWRFLLFHIRMIAGKKLCLKASTDTTGMQNLLLCLLMLCLFGLR